MRVLGAVTALCLALAGTAEASPIFTAEAGQWSGQGRIAAAAGAPLERGRCRFEVTPDDAGQEVNLSGKCVVAGGASQVAMRFIKADGSRIRAGVWSAVTDQTVQMAGQETDDAVTLLSLEPVIVDGTAYDTHLSLQFADDHRFTMQQLVRKPGDEVWTLVVEMEFQDAATQ